MERPIVVCDTNVWYKIATGEIATEELSNKYLIGTFINAHELFTTNLLLKKYDLVRKSVLALNNRTSEVLMETPLEQIKKASNYDYSYNDGYYAFQGLELVMRYNQLPNPGVTEKFIKENIRKNIAANEPYVKLKAELQEQIVHRGYYKRKLNETVSREIHLKVTKQNLVNLLGENELNWQQLELFYKTFDEWLFQLSVDPGLRISPNDWNDIYNLVYVQPGSYYWTRDERKTKKFIVSSGCGHYLIE